MYIGVFEYSTLTDYKPVLRKTFNTWSDAEEYAKKKYNYPEGDCIIQLTNYQAT